MPIRRAAATPPQDRAASPAPEEEPSEDSPPVVEGEGGATDSPLPVGEEGEVAASSQTNGEELVSGDVKAELEAENEGHARPTLANGDSLKCQDCAEGQCATHCYVLLKRIKDGGKLGKAKVRKMKKTIPPWASISANKKMAAAVSGLARAMPKVDEVLLEAVKSGSERTGMSYVSILKYVTKNYPSLELDKRKYLIRKALKRHLDKGSIKQLKGKGFAGSFAAQKQPANKKAEMKGEPLGDALPLIITRLCEPKEASYILIKKYLEQHFPQLHIVRRPDLLKSALVRAVDKGHLERITGKGASGTFQLKRSGDKVLLAGGALEDAISAAIIAMNEPKTCSSTSLRRYLCHAIEDGTETRIVALLRKTLTKCKMLGWMEQITGTGLNGTYRLAFPYYPSPAVLFPDRVIAPPKKKTPQRTSDTSEEEEETEEEEEESEEEEEESDDEPPPPPKRKAGKRPAPKTRRPPPSKKPRSASQSKARGRRAPPIKKQVTPAKKAPPPAKKPAAASKKAAPAKATPPPKATPTAKATPLKRAAPAKRPKTPAVKKLSARGRPRKATPQKATPQKATPRKATPRKATPQKATPRKAPARKEAKAPPPGRQSLRSKK